MCDCAACQESHERIESKIDHLDRLLEVHQAEVHGSLVEAETIREWDSATSEKVDRLADAIMGPQAQNFDGELHRVDADGLVAKVERVEQQVDSNSKVLAKIDRQVHNGIKTTITKEQIALLTAIFTAIAAAIRFL